MHATPHSWCLSSNVLSQKHSVISHRLHIVCSFPFMLSVTLIGLIFNFLISSEAQKGNSAWTEELIGKAIFEIPLWSEWL